MPKITVYLPDDLATDVKAAGISVSPICQRALEEEVKKMTLLRAWSGDERLAAARERLLATTAHEDIDHGRQQGREWALQMADHRPSGVPIRVPAGVRDRCPHERSWPVAALVPQ